MKTNRFFGVLALCTAIVSCEGLDDETKVTDQTPYMEFINKNHSGQPASTNGTYILNNGKWGGNDSNVGIYVPSSKTLTSDAFFKANGQKLGDLGQDMTNLDDELYIAVNGSQTVFVTDMDLELKWQINAYMGVTKLSPRCLTAHSGKVYVSYYEGYVFEIDAETQRFRAVTVGPNPEGLVAAGGKLYVANSGGALYPNYDKTVSVISLEDFAVCSTVEVNLNPVKVEASSDGNYVYVSSFGDYVAVPAKLQVIETATGEVSDLSYDSVSSIASDGDVMYVLCGGYDDNWNPLPGTIYKHDMTGNHALGAFVTDGTSLPDAYSISVARDGYIYVGCSDYTNNGDVYVFTSEGTLHDSFDSQGLNPQKAY